MPQRQARRGGHRPGRRRRRARAAAFSGAAERTRAPAPSAASSAGAARNADADRRGPAGVGAARLGRRTLPTGTGPCRRRSAPTRATTPTSTGQPASGRARSVAVAGDADQGAEHALLGDEPGQRRQAGHRRAGQQRRAGEDRQPRGRPRRACAGRGCRCWWSTTPTTRNSAALNSAWASSIASPASAAARVPSADDHHAGSRAG